MTAALCASPIQAEVVRITRLDECGIPVTGTNAQAVFDAFTEIQNSPNYEDGDRFLLKKANGQPCVNQVSPGFFNWLEQTVTLCTIDPTVLVLVTGERLITDGVTGVGVAFGSSGLLDQNFSLEVWQPVAGSNACDEGGNQQFFYWAFMNEFDTRLQDFSMGNDTFTLAWQAKTQVASTLWDLGDDWLPASGDVVIGDHFLFAITTTPPPEASCGTTAVS